MQLIRAAVLGRPVAHSLSPVLHTAAYLALGLTDWRYDAVDCGVDDLPGLLADAGPEWAGFSCTMPLKRVALELASTVRPVAAEVGSANTLLPGPDGWAADNTDVNGIMGALAEHAVPPGTATVLGAGGTAQAAVVALARLGLVRCALGVRDSSRTAEVLAVAERVGVRLDVTALDGGLDAELIVSTLPVGAADALSSHDWRPGQALLDVVYDPWPTPLAGAASAAGATVVSGALMLLHQAGAQVELMTGHPPPLAAMRAALRRVTPGAGV